MSRAPEKRLIEKIVSGGQTGADRAALDWAIANRVPHGGWCPNGRLAEDGLIPAKYRLTETRSKVYAVRTKWNVRDSDGTAIFTVSDALSGGSLVTLEYAVKQRRPWLHLRAADKQQAAKRLRKWIVKNQIRILNVAGPRRSHEPAVGKFVRQALTEALKA